jgi:hypothetical protein
LNPPDAKLREDTVAAPEDAEDVLCALRLGWFLAEVRGRNRPGGQLGAGLPQNDDHALPLRIERSPTELRIEAQKVVAQLAAHLNVDTDSHGAGFGAAIDAKARLLDPVRAPKASAALQRALGQLRMAQAGRSYRGASGPPTPQQALQTLTAAVDSQQQIVAAAQDQAAAAGEQRGLDALRDAVVALPAVTGGDTVAARARVELIRGSLQGLVAAASAAWDDLAELLWKFDAHIQDQLSATSEAQACGYQLGRGLAETYWALDPEAPDDPDEAAAGCRGWDFLLGPDRCTELSRLAGRLGAYMPEYTAPAITGSIEIWRYLAGLPAWRGDGQVANDALYQQIRRWYELIVLGQDPTTLVKPNGLISSYQTFGRAIRLFWPQLVATIVGLGFLVTLLVLLGVGGATTREKTLSGVLAIAGLSLGGLTGTLKNSAQAMLKRLRQDSYTDLVAIAVQTAPPPPRRSDLHKALKNRRLTTATPN